MDSAIIGDLHVGVKQYDPIFSDYFEGAYSALENDFRERGIEKLRFMGDITDSRKSIDYKYYQFLKNFIKPDFRYTILAGNHDCYYRNTNRLNSIRELFGEFNNVTIVDMLPWEEDDCLFVPWMNKENQESCMEAIEKTDAKYCFGHFPINGSLMTKGIVCGSSLKSETFQKFDKVFSGHFHLTQEIENIIYVGSMCQLNWNDYGDKKRYIHMTDEGLESVQLVSEIFKHITISDGVKFGDISEYKDKYLKIYLNRKLTKKEDATLDIIKANAAATPEIINNTILLESIGTEIKDEEINELIVSCVDTYEDYDESIREMAKDLILNEYNSILLEKEN